MAIFTRRNIQRRIDSAVSFLPRRQLQPIVERLNRIGRTAVEAEWELLWLTSLASIGEVLHEAKLDGGSSLPDVHFKDGSIEFIADVTTVSDAGYDEENPIDEFDRELSALYDKYDLVGGFSLEVGSDLVGEQYRDRRVRLFLPKRGEIPLFVRQNFEPFVRSIAEKPNIQSLHTVGVPTGGVISLKYNPSQRPYNHGAGHLGYNVPYSLSRNPITNALKSKKRQLAKAGWTGLLGIILCDGDCNILTTSMNSGGALSLAEIVHDFLRQNQSIAFVLTIGVQTKHHNFGSSRRTHEFRTKLYPQFGLKKTDSETLSNIFSRALTYFPPIVRNAADAVRLASSSRPLYANRSTFYGHWHLQLGNRMETTEVKISARALASLLGGAIDVESFRKNYQITSNVNGKVLDVFRRMLEDGRTIVEARIVPQPEADDDLIVLRFGPADAGASKFQVPEADAS